MQGTMQPAGILRLTRKRGLPATLTLRDIYEFGFPHRDLQESVYWWRVENWPRLLNQLWRLYLMQGASRVSGYPFLYGRLWLTKIDGRSGVEYCYGLASLRVVTNAGRDEIVDEFDAATAAGFDLTSLNFHGIGTGTNAEAAADTALQTELTTEYTGNQRATGTQSQPTSNVYRTLGTNTLDSGTPAVTEHGVLSQAATGGGTLLDRSVFSAINLVGANGDALQSTYDLTISSGG